MLRFIVTAYLLCSTALGPALCCCTLRELTFGPRGCCSPAATKQQANAGRAHEHHHCHNHAAGHPDGAKKPEPAAPERCPCDRHCASQVAVVEKSTLETECFAPGLSVPADAAISFDLPSFAQFDGLALEQHALDSPLFNSRAVLRALHVLRC